MSISSVSSSSNLQPGQMSDAFKQRKQDFTALANALQSGDIAGAQKAFAALQQDKQSFGQALGQPQGGQGSNSSAVSQTSQSGTSSMQDLMSQLKQALGSGDLQGAQQAFASIQQNMQANQSQGHHRHHHHGGSQPTPTSATSTGNTASPSGAAQAGGISTTA